MKTMLTTAAIAGALAFSPIATSSANAVVFLFDVTGILSFDGPGDAQNEVFNINVGANNQVVGIGWDVTLFADSPSYLEEAIVNFGSSSSGAVNLTVGIDDDFSGTKSYSSGGIVNLIGIGLDFAVNADGILRLEFFESFDDFTDDWDARWESGTISIDVAAVPEPGTWAMMIAGFGLIGFAARRRPVAA